MDKAVIVAAHAAGASPPAPASVPVPINAAACGDLVVRILRALPASRALAAGHVCAMEALTVFREAGINCLITDSTHADFPTVFIGYTVRLSVLLSSPAAASHAWPNLAPERLGKEILRFTTAATAAAAAAPVGAPPPPPPPRFPRVHVLQSLATDAATFDAFLLESVAVTVDSDRHERRCVCALGCA